ncbi:hypothetical protein DL96DRAFT_1810606 [Flagelloscypha sp. PMI_526]|nr:hypothetical protein DL96DRAFT_1810606 [Flagelloscypha sp. PMI_526]
MAGSIDSSKKTLINDFNYREENFPVVRLIPNNLKRRTISGTVLVTVQFLVEEDADVNATTELFGTALQAAVRATLEFDQFLVRNGIDIIALGGLKGTALQTAAEAWVDNCNGFPGVNGGNLEIIEFFVHAAVDVNAVRAYGTALQSAIWWSRSDIMQFLIQAGADHNIQGAQKITLDKVIIECWNMSFKRLEKTRVTRTRALSVA